MKNSKWWIFAIVLFLLTLGILVFLTCWDKEIKSQILQFSGIIITGLGFFIAIYQLKLSSNQYFDDLRKKKENYLDLFAQTKYDNNYYSIKTQTKNNTGEVKDIDFSFILITKQENDIIEDVKKIIRLLKIDVTIEHSDDFVKLRNSIKEPTFIENSIGIIPLDFYYDENIQIGNENPSYTYTFDNNKIKLESGIYSARYYIYPKVGLLRSTSDSLII